MNQYLDCTGNYNTANNDFNGESILKDVSNGLNVVTVDQVTGDSYEDNFNTANDDKEWNRFLLFIQSLKVCTFVLISVQDSIGDINNTSESRTPLISVFTNLE
ncbi:hypothetical protein PPL_10448 [Heterostelium album PN500]|uniref:ILEI/PANDER domain-containing protein n=1 Tax=Heterostelium pallidum (strain ATCC 26659 / Pp 5 / PN500) TaxID=670386 RepID=D3BR44_HETP5|nr:hypothetical protein PPL_10448 [Heterostelium album PN500]EFA75876.1 hypothetical protein PPL_10448 [Heterostelium album PN500]|eukprot:XP_020428010.1 hypothetical protein PPL_10448 [Heterostelium album PN500]